MTLHERGPITAALVAGLSLCAVAHEDDPKILDAQPTFIGPAWRSGTPDVYAAAVPTVFGQGGGQVIAATAATTGVSFPASGMQLLSWLPPNTFGGKGQGNSCWGYTSPSGREYALMGLEAKTGFVDITDPGNPDIVKKIAGPFSTWRNIKVYQDHAYIVSEGGSGIQVVDMSQIDGGIVTLVNTVTTGGSEATHTSWINEDTGFLYRSGGDEHGLRIYDLADPANPVHVATWDDRYVHAVTTFLYTSGPYAGKEIAFACGGYNNGWSNTGVSILDVTDKSNIKLLRHKTYSSPGYSHQAYPSEDKQYLYLSDELDENGSIGTRTVVFDISNLNNPIERPSFTNGSTAISHNFFVKGDLLYEANYRSGVRVFDKTNQLQPTEIAYFDTWPDNDKALFNGLWNTFPYFPSGVVIGSDRERGLFVWWVGDPLVAMTMPGGAPATFSPFGDSLTVQVTEQNGGDLVEGTEMFHYDDGAGWTTVPLNDMGASLYQADVPSGPCGKLFQYYFTAQSANGVTWTEPTGGPNVYYTGTYAVSRVIAINDDCQSDSGWTLGKGSDDATQGQWEHGNPNGTIAQPEDDVSHPGRKCFFTQNATSGLLSVGLADVDDGKTTLISAAYDTTGLAEAWISYWRWYSNDKGANPNEDTFDISISNQGGVNGTWVALESIGPAGPGTSGGWIQHQFRVSDFVTPTNDVKLRFIASDYFNDSLVEAAIDEIEVVDMACVGSPETYCTAGSSASGCQAALSASGTASASASSGFTVSATGVEGGKDGLYFFGTNGRQANTWGSGTSFQCVVPPVVRGGLLSAAGTAGACDGSIDQDLNALWCSTCPRPLKNPGAGAVVQAQLWYRDPMSTSNQTTSLSDAIEFAVAP